MPQVHDLLSLTSFPSMPAPFSSDGPGEAWVWGDFVLILQTRPQKVADALAAMTGQKAMDEVRLEYPFALTVFYRKDRNPHGPSSRPVIAATLEQVDYAAMLKLRGADPRLAEDIPFGSRTVLGLFTSQAHHNYGEYSGALTLPEARKTLFNLAARTLKLTGDPHQIGAIADVHGHQDTGWQAQEETKRRSGCLGLASIVSLIAFLSFFALRMR